MMTPPKNGHATVKCAFMVSPFKLGRVLRRKAVTSGRCLSGGTVGCMNENIHDILLSVWPATHHEQPAFRVRNKDWLVK